MYGLTRATTTLVFSAVAGLLIWFATQICNDHVGGYWARVGLVAGAGLLMALSQLLGGWTKWGLPRLSLAVFLTAFLPVAVVSLWVVLAGEPGSGWFHNHVMAWTSDIHISGLVTDFLVLHPGAGFRDRGSSSGSRSTRPGRYVRDREVVVDREADVACDTGRTGFFGRRRTADPRRPTRALRRTNR